MSKYQYLWKWIEKNGVDSFRLSFCKIERILGFEIDHSILNCKKELLNFGYKVTKIFMKEKYIYFEKIYEEKK